MTPTHIVRRIAVSQPRHTTDDGFAQERCSSKTSTILHLSAWANRNSMTSRIPEKASGEAELLRDERREARHIAGLGDLAALVVDRGSAPPDKRLLDEFALADVAVSS